MIRSVAASAAAVLVCCVTAAGQVRTFDEPPSIPPEVVPFLSNAGAAGFLVSTKNRSVDEVRVPAYGRCTFRLDGLDEPTPRATGALHTVASGAAWSEAVMLTAQSAPAPAKARFPALPAAAVLVHRAVSMQIFPGTHTIAFHCALAAAGTYTDWSHDVTFYWLGEPTK